MEDLLRRIVAFKSVTGSVEPNQALLTFLADFLAERGMAVQYYEKNGLPSFVATVKPHDLAPKVLLVAHSDVVPAPDELFTLRKEDNKYFGRGVLDMKFSIACFLQFVDDIKDNLDSYDFGIMITTDEEQGGVNGVGYLVEEIGYRPEVCIVPDGGMNWEIETFAKGVYWLDLEAIGVAGHASRPWEGEHAVHKLMEALTAIRAAYPYTGDQKATLLSVGTITGGEAANQLAEEAHATLDVRTGSLRDHEQVKDKITEIAKQYDVVVKQRGSQGAPCINDPENHYLRLFRSLITSVTGQEYSYSFSFAATDARYFTTHGIPAIIVQPLGGNHHSNNEWLSIEGFEQYYQMLRQFMFESALTPATVLPEETPAMPSALPQ
jgi:succinyl-diaminopimelate desuccinylase